jgi:hypothetical protein
VLEAFSPLLVIVIGGALAMGAVRSYTPRERGLILASFAAHVVAAVAQVLITREYYGGGDMMVYFVTGTLIADVVSYDPGRFLPEVWGLLVHNDIELPFYVMGAGGSTGTMSGISGLLQIVLGPSIYAVCMGLSVAAFFGQLALYRVFRELFPDSVWQRLVIATMLVPSVVFWSSAILKETIVMAAFGWVVLGLHRFVQGRRLVGLALILVAGFWVAMVKAYVLFALALAAVVWWYWRRALESTGGQGVAIHPVYLTLGAVAGVGMVVGLGELFPRFALENVTQEAASLQQLGAQVGGGSYYQVGGDQPQRSVVGQLAFAPLALLTSLFRPFVFEVRNATMAMNALETAAFAGLLVKAVTAHSWRGIRHQLTRSPTLMFALVFVLTFGVAVGLTSTNLGTLSRYRIPMVPFFAALLLLWNARSAAPKVASTPTAQPRVVMRRGVPTTTRPRPAVRG